MIEAKIVLGALKAFLGPGQAGGTDQVGQTGGLGCEDDVIGKGPGVGAVAPDQDPAPQARATGPGQGDAGPIVTPQPFGLLARGMGVPVPRRQALGQRCGIGLYQALCGQKAQCVIGSDSQNIGLATGF